MPHTLFRTNSNRYNQHLQNLAAKQGKRMASHMGVQTFATERNSQVEFFVHFILERFFTDLEKKGQLKDVKFTSQKAYVSEIASDVWDHFISATQSSGRQLEIWCQTTCYKGNGTGTPEPNKTYEVRETLVEGLSIRQYFKGNPDKDCRSVHFTVGDSRYTYQWFLDLKAAAYDKSIYIGEPKYDIFNDIAATLTGALTEQNKIDALRKVAVGSGLLAKHIKQATKDLEDWWISSNHVESSLANAQWQLIAAEFQKAACNWPDLSKIHGQDIKGRTNSAIFSEVMDVSDPLIPKTAAKLLSKNPFLSCAITVLCSWDLFCKELSDAIPASRKLDDFLALLWGRPFPERLVIRRLLVRIHSTESVAYVQDRDVEGITEHNIYSGDHSVSQTRKICEQIQSSLLADGIRTPGDLLKAIKSRGKQLINQARWFEAKNGTELKPSFDYVELALERAGFRVVTPSAAKLRAIGYHGEISSETVRPYTNLKAVMNASGKVICFIKAKFFRAQEFPRRCKEEAFVGLTLKYRYVDGAFQNRLNVPLIMFLDMATDCSPPAHAVKRLISFGWHAVFSTDDLVTFLRTR